MELEDIALEEVTLLPSSQTQVNHQEKPSQEEKGFLTCEEKASPFEQRIT
ncbi:hypothetical protein [Candidatus Methylacidithermus pantelleriae]|uniref:Uncharacterized protein n=1 Tax=Candidatus Methylacidithermus pantelleriae TaxID=2744239 RepID=A0A8J2FP68_9BACT|nr:hypothetical protein [Candidatus Methylacidithermus pantelleriae]CAF0700579.1 hypothetical protein MPNT_380019 [Candidatus Methylacidithermus pantelleriae]